MKIRTFTVGLLASVMLSANLISCAIPPASPTIASPATQTPTLVIPSQTPAPTETPTPSPESLLPQEVKEKFELAGVDLANMQNAEYDKDGLHITLPSGEVIVLTNDQLQKGMYNGQDNVLQYRDEANQNVIYAFDKETKTFLEASKYIQKDKTDPEKYIQVKDWDELYALWAKEKMFLIPFDPENTYFPPSDKIYRGYSDRANSRTWEADGEFNYYTPFGDFPAEMDFPFEFASFTRMPKDVPNGRSYDVVIISEKVFNPDDGTFSVLHFYMHAAYENSLENLQEQTADGTFFYRNLNYLKTS